MGASAIIRSCNDSTPESNVLPVGTHELPEVRELSVSEEVVTSGVTVTFRKNFLKNGKKWNTIFGMID